MLKLKDIRGEDTAELVDMLRDLQKEQFQIDFRTSSENVQNPARRRQVRRTIARIKTVLAEREAEAAKASTATENA